MTGLMEPKEEAKRTTVLLRPDDLRNLKAIARASGTTDTEVIRRALRLMRELLSWESDEGGQIILEKGAVRERIRFL